ncbi:hypothetical protein BDV95DRAFT_291865 [Massariosphaeria phaeospora]|uniref:Rhodopsin domain-containing protein n=1 Tax=Massariosphaeria phaeospora TaxID=100035 RepID=A0A7C8I252_9PLEO|nr:hypothetical protein BDV95DRAFT_291865 [Massariosphaeria phaeospora]
MSTPAELSGFDKTNDAMVCSAVLLVLATISIAIRECSRRIRKVRLAPYDYLLYTGYLLFVALTSATLWSTVHGALAEATWPTLSPQEANLRFKVFFATSLLWIATNVCVKLSVLFLYRSIFGLQTPWFRIAWWANVLWVCPGFLVIGFAMMTYTYTLFDKAARNRTKPPDETLNVFVAWMNAVPEMCILMIPIPHLIALQMNKRKKYGVIGVFCIGIV